MVHWFTKLLALPGLAAGSRVCAFSGKVSTITKSRIFRSVRYLTRKQRRCGADVVTRGGFVGDVGGFILRYIYGRAKLSEWNDSSLQRVTKLN